MSCASEQVSSRVPAPVPAVDCPYLLAWLGRRTSLLFRLSITLGSALCPWVCGVWPVQCSCPTLSHRSGPTMYLSSFFRRRGFFLFVSFPRGSGISPAPALLFCREEVKDAGNAVRLDTGSPSPRPASGWMRPQGSPLPRSLCVRPGRAVEKTLR